MDKLKKKILVFLILFFYLFETTFVFAQEIKYPDYTKEFVGVDKYENYNRKMFNFNQKLNKYAIRPVHILWASIVPQYGMDRLLGISENIKYPSRLVSCLIQGDFKAAAQETGRFFINTTIGIAGMYDPAKYIMRVEQVDEDMEQALAKCHFKANTYFVLPVILFTNYRDILGRILDAVLDPTTYIGTPVLAVVKAGLTINRTSFMQAFIKVLDSDYPDPYNVYRTLYAINSFAKHNNYDRVDVITPMLPEEYLKPKKKKQKKTKKVIQETRLEVSAGISGENNFENLVEYRQDYYEQQMQEETINTKQKSKKQNTVKYDKNVVKQQENVYIEPNILLSGYNPQNPFTDSMRTALFYIPSAEKSIWNELSVWNRSFKKRIKSAEINITPDRKNYKYRYLMQKDKNAPLAIIYPSTGVGVSSSHSVMFAKIFYDAGYSILIVGNPFQWEFVESMPEDFRPGLPANDAKMLKNTTAKIIEELEKKYQREFQNKVVIGTSYGAMVSLFMAEQESKENTLGKTQFIAICPPIDLLYSISVLDNVYNTSLSLPTDKFRELVATVASKSIKLLQMKKDVKFQINAMPYTEEESRFLTSFLMQQKLSDVIFVIEKAPKNKKSDIYEKTSNVGYVEYSKRYLNADSDKTNKKMLNESKLTSLSNYLKKADNYTIYHTPNDYLTTSSQLKQLKQMAGNRLILLDNGAHLGFTYRPEFMDNLNNTIMLLKQQEKL